MSNEEPGRSIAGRENTVRENTVRDSAVAENRATLDIVEHALQNLWAVANDLSHIRPRSDFYRVSVFGSARTRPGDPLYAEVVDLGRRLAEMGCDVVTGGGPGLMQAANEGEQIGDPTGRTRAVGVRVDLPFEVATNPFVEKMYSHRTFFSRLHQFVRLSNAFIVVRGGIGTTLEALMVWQLLQVRHVNDVPLVLLGPMWHELVEWAKRNMIDREPATANAEDILIARCVDTVDEAVAVIAEHQKAFEAARAPA